MVTNSGTPPRAGAIRALNGPATVEVKVDQRGQPSSVRLNPPGRRRPKKWLRVQEVLDVWRVDDEWWTDKPISRLYHQLDLDETGTVVLFQDLITGTWSRQQA